MGCSASGAVTPRRVIVAPKLRWNDGTHSRSSTRLEEEEENTGHSGLSSESWDDQEYAKLWPRRTSVWEHYELGQKVGQGACGYVYRAVRKRDRKVCAVKSMPTSLVKAYGLQHEAEILGMLDHPNIVKLYDWFQASNNNRTYLIMELCEGTELLQQVQFTSGLQEKEVALIMRQIIGAVGHMHCRQVCHRDVKPENFRYSGHGPVADTPLRTVDFGLAATFRPGQLFHKKVGTLLYMSPEVLKEKYDHTCDLWSCGCLLYVLLSGSPAFAGDTEDLLNRKIMKARVRFPSGKWRRVSKEAKDLISKLLSPKPAGRLSADRALRHSWIEQNAPTQPQVLVISEEPTDTPVEQFPVTNESGPPAIITEDLVEDVAAEDDVVITRLSILAEDEIRTPNAADGLRGTAALSDAAPEARVADSLERPVLERPRTGTERPRTGLVPQVWGGTLDRPPTGLERPPTGMERPTTGMERPVTGMERPRTGMERPTTGMGRPRTGQGNLQLGLAAAPVMRQLH